YGTYWVFGFEDAAPRLFRAMAMARLGRLQQAMGELKAMGSGRWQPDHLDVKTIGLLAEATDLLAVSLEPYLLSLFRSAESMNFASWDLVRKAGASQKEYEAGLILAKEACALCPNEGRYRTALGVALLRNERWSEALEC